MTVEEISEARLNPDINVTDVEMAFGIQDTNKYLTRSEAGEEYWRGRAHGARWAEHIFFNGLNPDKVSRWKTKKGAPPAPLAWRFLHALLKSWAPKHEAKIATVGFYLDQWFQLPKKVR